MIPMSENAKNAIEQSKLCRRIRITETAKQSFPSDLTLADLPSTVKVLKEQGHNLSLKECENGNEIFLTSKKNGVTITFEINARADQSGKHSVTKQTGNAIPSKHTITIGEVLTKAII